LPTVKAFVVYDTKCGNTKLVAEKIVEGMMEVEGIETAISVYCLSETSF
jgi:flavodoxin